MTTATATRRPSWLLATRTLIDAHLRVAVWFWGILLLLLLGAHLLMSGIIPTRVLVAQYGTHATTWFAFTLALIFVLAYLPVHVLSGMTRRAFIGANLITAPAMGLGYGGGLFLLVLLERMVFPEAQVPHDTDPLISIGSGAPWGVLVGQTLLSTTAILSGILVALSFYRLKPLVGLVLLIPTVGPVLAMTALTASDAPVQLQRWLGLTVSTGGAIAIALLVIAMAAAAFHLTARSVPIAPAEQK